MLLGCIGDDFTGSSDIANTLAKGGMAVTQYNGVPNKPAADIVEAGVVSLKSRMIVKEDAIGQSLEAAKWLIDQGCEQIFFKYCSTFDSTPEGNIGPVADALADFLGEDQVIFCPAFPATGRSIYQGHLFVNGEPLHESGMRHHPLTPMTDSDLCRWLAMQTKRDVKLLPFDVVHQGSGTIREFLNEQGGGHYVADAILDEHLVNLGQALSKKKLLTGGSGLALGLPENFRQSGQIARTQSSWQGAQGQGVILSGSCSIATRKQIGIYKDSNPALEISAESVVDGTYTPDSICEWVLSQSGEPLVYSSADPSVVAAAQENYGREFIAEKIEKLFSELALKLFENGVTRIVSAGGETSGAVVTGLAINSMQLGPEIDPGVPALKDSDRNLVVALKSGNFGGDDFFEKALKVLAND